MDIPLWALSASYWFHMLATVIWIGGLTAFSLFIVPSSKHLENTTSRAVFLEKAQQRLDALSWFSLLLLVGTGLIQMSANPNYGGFLAFSNRWALFILIKHIVFLGMTILSGIITWGTIPALRRAILRQTHGQEVPGLARLQSRNLTLLRLNLLLGLIILALTALARAAV